MCARGTFVPSPEAQNELKDAVGLDVSDIWYLGLDLGNGWIVGVATSGRFGDQARYGMGSEMG